MADNDTDLERKLRAELERLDPEGAEAGLRREFIEDFLNDYDRKREETSQSRFRIIAVIGLLGILAAILIDLLIGNQQPIK